MLARRIVVTLLSCALLAGSHVAVAALVSSPKGSITRIVTYTTFGGGDVVFTLSAPLVGCYGFWLRPTDAGFKNNLATLLAAYHNRTQLVASGYNDQTWAGSRRGGARK